MDPEQSHRETKNKNEKPLYDPNSESASDIISKPPSAKQEEVFPSDKKNVTDKVPSFEIGTTVKFQMDSGNVQLHETGQEIDKASDDEKRFLADKMGLHENSHSSKFLHSQKNPTGNIASIEMVANDDFKTKHTELSMSGSEDQEESQIGFEKEQHNSLEKRKKSTGIGRKHKQSVSTQVDKCEQVDFYKHPNSVDNRFSQDVDEITAGISGMNIDNNIELPTDGIFTQRDFECDIVEKGAGFGVGDKENFQSEVDIQASRIVQDDPATNKISGASLDPYCVTEPISGLVHVIKRLKLVQILRQEFPNVTVQMVEDKVKLYSSQEEAMKASEHFQRLISSLQIQDIHFRKPLIAFLNKKRTQEVVYGYMDKQNVSCYFLVEKTGGESLKLYCLYEQDIKKSAEIIKETIQIKTGVQSDIANEVSLKFPDKCMIYRSAEDEVTVTLIYTKDCEHDINECIAEQRAQTYHTGTNGKVEITGKKYNSDTEHNSYVNREGSDTKIEDNESQVESLTSFTVIKGSLNSEPFDCVGSIHLDTRMKEYVVMQEDFREIRSSFNGVITTDDHISVNGDKVEVTKTVEAVKNIAKSISVQFTFSLEVGRERSDEWKSLVLKAEQSNMSITTLHLRKGFLPYEMPFLFGQFEIQIHCGLMEDILNAGMIVCPVNRCFLPNTPISQLIFETAGEKLLENSVDMARKFVEANRNTHPPLASIHFSEVVGNLSCEEVAYIVVPDNYSEDENLELKMTDRICHILETASHKQLGSLLFPLEISKTFSVQRCISSCISAIQQTSQIVGAVLKVYLCVLTADNLKPVHSVLKAYGGKTTDDELELTNIYTDDAGLCWPNVEIEIGSLVDHKVDAVVCIKKKSLDLKQGCLSDLILKAGGEEIQTELKQHSSIGCAEVVVTKGGKLPCKNVLFGNLPKVKKDDKDSQNNVIENLKLFLEKVYERAKQHRLRSIAFPVLGTGGLGYELRMVAREMFRAVFLHASKNGVEQVRFVLVEEDKVGQKVFSEMRNAFQLMKENKGMEESETTHIEVKIGSLDTKIIVVKNKDNDAPMADVIVESMDGEDVLQADHPYNIKQSSVESDVFHSDHYSMQFHAAPSDTDFKRCCKELFKKLPPGTIVSLDFTKGLNDDLRNYAQLALEEFVSHEFINKHLKQITLVVTEKMFRLLIAHCSSAEIKNRSFKETVGYYIPSILSGPRMSWYLKQTKPGKIHGMKNKCLVIVHSRDNKRLTSLMTDIQRLAEKHSGPSVVKGDLKPGLKSLSPDTDKLDVKKDPGRSSYTSLTAQPSRQDNQIPDLGELAIESKQESALETVKTETESQLEVFGHVDAVIIRKLTDMRNNCVELRDGKCVLTTKGSEQHVKFDFTNRYEVQDILLDTISQNSCKTTSGNKSKENSDTEEQHIITDVDDSLFKLLRSYLKENATKSELRLENLKRDGNRVEVVGGKAYFDAAYSKVKALRSWNTETVVFKTNQSDEAKKIAEELKDKNPNIIIILLKNELQISGPSEHTTPAKHKASVALGLIKPTGRRKRQFIDEFQCLPTQTSMNMAVSTESSLTNDTTSAPAGQYQTKEGVTVKVYKGDITRLQVDCIVNAANEQLSHGGGVASAIAKAAGPAFQSESDAKVSLYGQFAVTKCVETSAGNMSYKYVLHAVGPRFTSYSDAVKALQDLEDTVVNVLQLAEQLDMKSVAIPSISAGIFGGNINDCASAYAKGILRYSRQRTLSLVKQIHFVDIQEKFVQVIQSAFDTIFALENAQVHIPVEHKDLCGLSSHSNILNHGVLSNHENESSSDSRNVDAHNVSVVARSSDKDFRDTMPQFEGCVYSAGSDYLHKRDTEKEHSFHSSQKVSSHMSAIDDDSYKPDKDARGPVERECLFPGMGANEGQPSLHDDYPMTYAKVVSKYPPTNTKRNTSCSKNTHLHRNRDVFGLYSEFHSEVGIKISVMKGDISLLDVDGIVCPDDTTCSGLSNIAKAIQKATGGDSIWRQAKAKNPNYLSALWMPTKPGIPYKYVIIAFSPRWTAGKRQQTFTDDLKKMVSNILRRTRTELRSIAFPVIGIGDSSTPFRLCCEVLCEELINFANSKDNKDSMLTNLTVISLQEQVVSMCQKILTNKMSQHLEHPMSASENHPYCFMDHEILHIPLPGFEKLDTIKIFYTVPSGIQKEGDPSPGRYYFNSTFWAFLPANKDGQLLVHLFSKAVEKGLVFKVKNLSGAINWSGKVEHKTSMRGKRYSYPDADYLKRVKGQLGNLGIRPDSEFAANQRFM